MVFLFVIVGSAALGAVGSLLIAPSAFIAACIAFEFPVEDESPLTIP